MTTGRINQVNIFIKKRQKLTQQSQTPARHMHPVALKNTAQPNTNSTLLLSSADSYSLLSLIERQKHDRNEFSLHPAFPHTDCKNATHATSRKNQENKPNSTATRRGFPPHATIPNNSISFYKTE